MTAWDARHCKKRMVMLFMVHEWLPVPENLTILNIFLLTESFSGRGEPSQGCAGGTVSRRLPLGKWTEMCSLSPTYLFQTASSRHSPQQRLLAQPWASIGLCFAGSSASLPPYQLRHQPAAHVKPQQASQKQRYKAWWVRGGKSSPQKF